MQVQDTATTLAATDRPDADFHSATFATSAFTCSDSACYHCAVRQAAAGRAWRARRFSQVAATRRAARSDVVSHPSHGRLSATLTLNSGR